MVFCDIAGSTALGESTDPEALRALLARYFERMKRIVEAHGGSVEKFIGDAVMAVFGVPMLHEDDALRALRAAVEMREAFPELGVQGRIGVATGEVVTGTEERLATGDAVNVAARLQQAAQPGELLIGAETLRLTRSVIEVEPVEPLTLKGKAEPVQAARLLSVAGEGFERRGEAAMVGRQRERRLLADAWERVVSERSCHLFTILGPAGVGKSRLAAEFLSAVEGSSVLRGRCLPYGEGITYWPVVEVLKQLPEVEAEETATATIRGLLGEVELVSSSEEIAWAFRKVLEAVAAERPFVCLFDDLQWGEETFLDLVEHVADLSRDAPILLLCMARPDLLDRRSGWGGGKVNATTVLLEPLAPEETELLIDSLAELDDDVRARIKTAAEGNPLFVEEMVAMLRDSPDGHVVVPPTIQALLAARLDQLDQPERDVLQCGSVEGRVFHGGAVQALAPEERQVTVRLTGLVRKELVRPDKPQFPGEDAFRFRHLLIRDAAYDALPKSSRAELHERFAAWLEEHGNNLVELDEVLGFHLEQAYRYRVELGPIDEPTRALGRRGATRLTAAAGLAHGRNDMPAASNMFERAASLRPADDPARLELLPMLGDALMQSGDLAGAENVLDEALDRARAVRSKRLEAHARIRRSRLVLQSAPEQAPMDEVLVEAERAIGIFQESGDDLGLAYAWHNAGLIHDWSGRAGLGEEAFERAVGHARRARSRAAEAEALIWLSLTTFFGPTPAEDGIRRCQEILRQAEQNVYAQAHVLVPLGALQAMCGHIGEGRESVARGRAVLFDLGLKLAWGGTALPAGELELLAGDPAAAERVLGEGYELLETLGDRGYLSSIAARLAEALHRQGREEEALRYAVASEDAAAGDDLDAQAGWRAVMAKILARRGQGEDAVRVAREALELLAGTDMLDLRAQANESLAEVLRLSAKQDEAVSALTQAIELHEQKGNFVAADRARRSFGDLQESAAPT